MRNVRQLTFGGQNAEAYFDWTGSRLIFQSTRAPFACDQIFTMRVDGSDVRLCSTGRGRTTCGFFFPDGRRVIYASTHLAGDACPPAPDRSAGYVWPLYAAYDLFAADPDGGNLTRLTTVRGTTRGRRVAGRHADRLHVGPGRRSRSLRHGRRRRNVRRLTDGAGYDGGAFFSWDGSFIVFRASRPAGAELEEYRTLLRQGLVRPRRLEIFVMRADGSGVTQVTRNGAANFAPFMHPDSRRVIFASNLHDPDGRGFALYLINADGSGLERVTWADSFASYRCSRETVPSSSSPTPPRPSSPRLKIFWPMGGLTTDGTFIGLQSCRTMSPGS